MNAEVFVNALRRYVHESAKRGVLEDLVNPPGKAPSTDDACISEWYMGLSDVHRTMVERIVDIAVGSSVLGFLCVLDGVRAVEDTSRKGRFELYYVGRSERILLNEPEQEYLHDIYEP